MFRVIDPEEREKNLNLDVIFRVRARKYFSERAKTPGVHSGSIPFDGRVKTFAAAASR